MLYKAACVNKSKCPEAVKNIGVHAPMCYRGDDGVLHWDYNSVKKHLIKAITVNNFGQIY